MEFLNSNFLLYNAQYGFRPALSTVHAISDIVSTSFDNIKSKNITGLLLLDLTKAFDAVQHDILLSKLQHYGIRDVVNRFFCSYLPERYQFVSINNIYSKRPQSNRVLANQMQDRYATFDWTRRNHLKCT